MDLHGSQPPPSGRLVARKLPRPEVVEEVHVEDTASFRVEERSVSWGLAAKSEEVHIADGERSGRLDLRGRAVKHSFSGPTLRNEEKTFDVAHAVARAIASRTGLGWSPPEKPAAEDGIDWVSVSDDGESKLLIQVTRAVRDQQYWQELAATGRVDRHHTLDELADQLWAAISPKARHAGIGSICLALDARYAAAAAVRPVVDEFRGRYLGPLVGLGFEQVWLVGPIDDLIFRLDERMEAPFVTPVPDQREVG